MAHLLTLLIQRFTGMDEFQYTFCNDGQPPLCDTGLVVLTVGSSIVAVDDEIETMPDTPVMVDVLDNDEFPNGSNPTVTLIPNTGPNNGEVILNPDNTFALYTRPKF